LQEKDSSKTDKPDIHELLSCIIILSKYTKILQKMRNDIGKKIDFEFIVRCILRIPYTKTTGPKVSVMNIMIGLINSKYLDMDKLDYIIRDSFYTGISVPVIDTKRLFRNMFISKQNELVYKSKAVPVIQTIIETRDNLYLWVYNHHTVVYTDFLYHYILRRLHYNFHSHGVKKKANTDINMVPIKGVLDRKVLFSIDAITDRLVSDSTLRYFLSYSYLELNSDYHPIKTINERDDPKVNALKRVYFLLDQLFRRKLLKPWWKTLFEYENFMHSKISDDKIRRELAGRVCSDKYGIDPAEFRSQIAKGVIELSKRLKKTGRLERYLCDGDFFIVERSNRFYSLSSIEGIMIYLEKNSIINPNLKLEGIQHQENVYLGKFLSKLLPQKNYEDFLNKDSFYLYINPEPYNIGDNWQCLREMSERTNKSFYEKIEQIFISMSLCLASMSATEFKNYYTKFNNFEDTAKERYIPEEFKALKNDMCLKFPILHTENGEERND
jgi:HD superfamily phosphohydrolase